ncbi:MAG: hypothetical protein GY765_14160, partial [bacterium]|nr:hypothetical protein [bacterium]
ANPYAIDYTYTNVDAAGGVKFVRQTMQFPHKLNNPSRIIRRDFDILNRLSKISEEGNDGEHGYAAYDYIGRTYRMLRKQYGNKDTINYLYDNARRVTSKETISQKRLEAGAIINGKVDDGLISHYKYGYNKVHMKTFEQRVHDGGKGDAYQYDALQRLTEVKYDVPDVAENHAEEHTGKSWKANYDKVDNLLSLVKSTGTIFPEIDNAGDAAKNHQYSRFDDWALTYDKNGNTTQKGTQKFYYNYRN